MSAITLPQDIAQTGVTHRLVASSPAAEPTPAAGGGVSREAGREALLGPAAHSSGPPPPAAPAPDGGHGSAASWFIWYTTPGEREGS